MSVGRYKFRTGVTAFFEMATSDARTLLPEHLEPIEARHQRSVLAATAFLFDDSVVGPYTELMFSVIVPPVAGEWGQGRHPKAGFYPFLMGTTSEEARRIKGERFHFPYMSQTIDAQFIETPDRLRVRAWASSMPLIDFSVTQGAWESTSHLLQSFMMNGTQRLRATLQITGNYTVHENERGTMTLYQHPLTAGLLGDEVSPYPFREHWLKDGTEVFYSLEDF